MQRNTPKWTRKAAERGYAEAQFNLGRMYENGLRVSQDYAEAIRWYRLAAGQGNADAQNRLGIMYINGRGVPQNYAEAARWFRLAAKQGNTFARVNLGIMYDGASAPVPGERSGGYLFPALAGRQADLRVEDDAQLTRGAGKRLRRRRNHPVDHDPHLLHRVGGAVVARDLGLDQRRVDVDGRAGIGRIVGGFGHGCTLCPGLAVVGHP